jgi:hypothetical protein
MQWHMAQNNSRRETYCGGEYNLDGVREQGLYTKPRIYPGNRNRHEYHADHL